MNYLNRLLLSLCVVVLSGFFSSCPAASITKWAHVPKTMASDFTDSIGHMQSLTIGDKVFSADLAVNEPITNSAVKIVGAIEKADFKGGYDDPIEFRFWVSESNWNELKTILKASPKSMPVIFQFVIFQQDGKKKTLFRTFHSNDATLNGSVKKTNGTYDLVIKKTPHPEVRGQKIYQIIMTCLPTDTRQDLFIATTPDKKFVKPWGITK